MTHSYYADLAASLREAADRIASFDDRDLSFPSHASLYLSFGYSTSSAPQNVPAVNAIAGAFGATAKTKVEGRGDRRRADHEFQLPQGPLLVHVRTSVMPPPLKRRSPAEMQAELDRLNNELAEAKRSQG